MQIYVSIELIAKLIKFNYIEKFIKTCLFFFFGRSKFIFLNELIKLFRMRRAGGG